MDSERDLLGDVFSVSVSISVFHQIRITQVVYLLPIHYKSKIKLVAELNIRVINNYGEEYNYYYCLLINEYVISFKICIYGETRK